MTLPWVPWAFSASPKCAANLLVQLGLGQIALDVRHFLRKPLPRRLVDLIDVELRVAIPDEAFQHVVKWSRQLSAVPGVQRHADQRKFLRQHLGAREIVECRYHQALGQVATRHRRSPWRRDRPAWAAARGGH